MNDLKTFKSINKFSKLSIIFQLFIFIAIIVFIVILPIVIVANSSYTPDPLEKPVDNSLGIDPVVIYGFGLLLCIVFGVLTLIFNIIIIVKSCSLEQSKDKNLLIIMSILYFFFLGIISNIVTLIVSKTNIKILSNGSNNTVVNESTKSVGTDIY